MYSTGIGLVIETLYRMEHDEQLRASQEAIRAQRAAAMAVPTQPVEIETPIVDDPVDEPKTGKGGIGVRIITRLSEIFKPDDIK